MTIECDSMEIISDPNMSVGHKYLSRASLEVEKRISEVETRL